MKMLKLRCDVNCTAVALGTCQKKAEINIVYIRSTHACIRCVLLLSKFLNKSIEAQS